jgi:predicted metal-dependent phosphoesterase TrpH
MRSRATPKAPPETGPCVMKLKIDLHVHTAVSRDAFIVPKQLPTIVKERGLDGVAVTNHDVFTRVTSSEVIILPGIEVSTQQGHIIGLGISGPIERGRTADETISTIRDVGGVAIVPHPFDPVSPCVNPLKLRSRPDAIEVINADALFFGLNMKYAKQMANRLGLPMVAGSDSHIPETVGDAYTLIEADSKTLGDILNAIRAGSVQPVGGPTHLSKKLLKMSRTLRRLASRTIPIGLDPTRG